MGLYVQAYMPAKDFHPAAPEAPFFNLLGLGSTFEDRGAAMGVFVSTGDELQGLGESWWRKAVKYATTPQRAIAETAYDAVKRDVKRRAANNAKEAELNKLQEISQEARIAPHLRGGMYFKELGRLTAGKSPAHLFLNTFNTHNTMSSDILAFGKKLSSSQRKAILANLHSIAAELDKKKKPRGRDEMLLLWRYVESVWSKI